MRDTEHLGVFWSGSTQGDYDDSAGGSLPLSPDTPLPCQNLGFFFVFLITAILIGDPGVVLIAFLSWIRMLTFLRLFASYLLFFSENCLFN
jgi:hypothetical protein